MISNKLIVKVGILLFPQRVAQATFRQPHVFVCKHLIFSNILLQSASFGKSDWQVFFDTDSI
jgi:hypothetical protein